jgi:hypothetical protein
MRGRVNAALALAVGSLVAALAGVLLGQGAIGEINPLYFEPIEPVRAVDPNAAQTSDGFASAYGWDSGQAAMAADCGANCGSAAYVYPYSDPPAMRAGGPYWRDGSPTTELPPWPPGQVSSRPAAIERYMHYPIEEGAADAPGAAALKVPDDEAEPAAAPSVEPEGEPSEPVPTPDEGK